MKTLLKIAFALLGLFWNLLSVAQIEAQATLDNQTILVGDQTGLNIALNLPATYEVKWPVLNDTITGNIEIIKKTSLESTASADKSTLTYIQKLTITSFDSGFFAIPPMAIQYRKPGDSAWYTTETQPLLLGVNTVPVNLQGEIKDIKPPEHAPFTFREALPYLLIFIGAALAAFFGIWYFKKRKLNQPVFMPAPKPQLPAHQLALDALQNLRLKKLWQNGHIKEYHTELTDIIREYLHLKFGIQAQEFTSDEIMAAVNKTNTNEQAKNKLRQTLNMADMVKFAKMQPLPVEHDASLNYAIDFVNETLHLSNNGTNHQPLISTVTQESRKEVADVH